MRLLVTGGAGFMGSNFIRYILREYPDYKIVNLDKLTYAGNLENLRDIEKNPNYKFVKGDICDSKTVDPLAREADEIINYAAETHVDRSIISARDFAMTDVIGTQTLLEAAKKYKHPRYIQISTDEVFGSIEKGKFTESSPFLPNSPYAASKAGGDLLCRAYAVTYKMPIIVTHSCNFFGPNQYPEKIIPLFITNLLEGKKVPLYGEGGNTREWIFTEDHCAAIDLILHKGKAGEIYNIGTGEERTNLETTKLILKLLGKDESNIEKVKDRPAHDWRYALDSSKLRALGWKPEYNFKKALEKTVEWYKNNENWWKPLKSGEYLKYYERQYKNR